MDEKQAEIPTFKVAKVGQSRKRPLGGLPLMGAGGSAASSTVVGGMGTLAAKLGVSVLVAALGAGAYGVGKVMTPSGHQTKAHKQVKIFTPAEPVQIEGDISQVPATAQQPQSSLGMIGGSLDGMTPEQRAAQQAEAEAAAQAEAEAQAKAEQTPAEQPTAAGSPVNPAGMDPAALAAAAAGGAVPGADQAKKSGSFGNKIGGLSSGFGGSQSGLHGGGGMFGGVGKGFEPISVKPNTGRTTSFSQGSGAGRAGSARAASVGQSGRRGLARKQLDKAFHLSKASQHGGAESRSHNATMAFENNPGVNSSIGGSGAGIGSRPTEGATPIGANPGGGGAGSNPTTLEDDYGYEETAAPPKPRAKNITPWQGLIDMAKMLLMIAGVLLLIASLLGYLYRKNPYQHWLWTAATKLGMVVVALAGMATLLGLMILGTGQLMQGTMFTVLGAITTWAGYKVATMPEAKFAVEVQTAEQMAAAKQTAGIQFESVLQPPPGPVLPVPAAPPAPIWAPPPSPLVQPLTPMPGANLVATPGGLTGGMAGGAAGSGTGSIIAGGGAFD